MFMPDSIEITTASDERLISEALRGDAASFGVIVERYWNLAVALALSRIDDIAEAEDIAQESFIKAHLHMHKLRDPACFAGWLTRIVSQKCADVLRRRTRERAVYGDHINGMESLSFTPSSNPGLTIEQTSFIRQAVRKMPEKFRRLIIMRFVAGLSAVQIAKQLGKSPGSIRTRLHRAYNILRKDLAPILEEVES